MMRKVYFLIILVMLLVISVYTVRADNVYDIGNDTGLFLPGEEPGYPIIQYFGVPDPAGFAEAPAVDIETYALEPITPADTSGLKAVLLSVLGDYESIVTDYRYQNASGNWQYLREVQPDYVWCCSAGIFALLLWCVFRMAGGLFCRR